MKEAIASSALFEQQEVDGFHHVELQCLPLTLRNWKLLFGLPSRKLHFGLFNHCWNDFWMESEK